MPSSSLRHAPFPLLYERSLFVSSLTSNEVTFESGQGNLWQSKLSPETLKEGVHVRKLGVRRGKVCFVRFESTCLHAPTGVVTSALPASPSDALPLCATRHSLLTNLPTAASTWFEFPALLAAGLGIAHVQIESARLTGFAKTVLEQELVLR